MKRSNGQTTEQHISIALREFLAMIDEPPQVDVETVEHKVDATSASSVAESVLANRRLWIDWVIPNFLDGVFMAAEKLTWDGHVDQAYDLVLQFNSLPQRMRQWEGVEDYD